ncbi:hypothetical protein UFOVP51_81 [uncultured Caudovirales phage]|uniref:Portal protein n=1 Tax=uncultured Caudovirales phage TaxID=2100421 RepID=A0A6J5KPE4_9CAUD|nr:hypothetical protein UFOVP51_81 [uncultured Caudovirales phage]CAB4240811.1 hypothetical protein UFOVP34_25 [uncultured Caudovirales phage]
MKTADEDIRKIEELEDGSSLYEIGDTEDEVKTEDTDFYENLAIGFSDEARKKLSSFLLEAIEQDIEVREQWLTPVEKAKKYLGFSLEDLKDIPFSQATRTFDTTLATALIRFYATARAELLPQDGPAGFKINGNSDEEVERKGELNRDLLNYYLTIEDQSYYSDFERFLFYLGFYGSGFKKVYYDKISKRPLSRFILPTDFVIDADCTSILESNRLTHILHLTKREIILNQQNKIYRDVDLPYLKTLEVNDDEDESRTANKKSDEIDLGAYAKRSLFPIYEVHTYLNLEDFTDSNNDSDQIDIPLPYIVTIDKISKEILSIRKNWTEEDEEKKREEYFIQYNYLPGFGIYGYGLAHLMGSNAISLTTILRQLIDAGTFKNLPGGLRAKGFKTQTNDIIVGPGQFIEVDTGGIPLSEAFMPLPYSEPSATLHQLMMEERNQCKELASTSEMGMLDSKEDIPVGTTLAMLETNNRIQSAVLRSIHFSFSRELQLIDKIFRRTIDTKEFNFGSESKVITSNDFIDEVMIIPVSDPSVNSTTQRIIKAEAILKTAQLAPELHNLREVFKLNYEAQGLNIEAIDKILIPSEEEKEVLPLDPISENLNIMKNEPVKAAIWQEHAAHKLTHGLFAQMYPDLQPQIMAHIKEHDAYEYLIQMQQLLGMELPPLDQITDPETQNTIAVAIAGALDETQGNQEQQQAPIDPNALLMADIQQKQAETEAKERIANQKTETDIFRAQLDFEKEKAKIESAEEIAKLKAETDMAKSELDFEKEQAKIVSIEEMAQLKSQTELIKNGGEIDQNY